MIDTKELENKLKEAMTIDGEINKRFYHSLGVAEKAIEINKQHNLGLDENKLYIAGLLHDAAKLYNKEELLEILKQDHDLDYLELKNNPQVLHSFAGKYVVKDIYKIDDEEILNAIYYHTTGRKQMTLMEQVIFVADFVEDRTRLEPYFDSIRKALEISLDFATYKMLITTKEHLDKQNKKMFSLGLEAYDYYKELIEKNRLNNVVKSLEKAVVDNIKIYDMQELTPFYDYVIIASASSTRQAAAAINYVKDDEEKKGEIIKTPIYDTNSTWLLLDLKDIIIHVFVGDERDKYNLDNMYENYGIK